MCEDILSAGGYNKEKHGDILYFRYNNKEAKQFAMHAILSRDPSEPAIVIGYSWGGAAALELASTLTEYQQSMAEQSLVNEDMIKLANLDLLLTIEPEPDGRMNTPSSVGKNVRLAVNIAAADGWPEKVYGIFGGRDHFGNVQNGRNKIQGALNVDIEEVNGVRMNHHTIIDLNAGNPTRDTSINPRTRAWGSAGVTVALWGY